MSRHRAAAKEPSRRQAGFPGDGGKAGSNCQETAVANTDKKGAGGRAGESQESTQKGAEKSQDAAKPSGDSPKPHGDPLLHVVKDK